MADKKISVLNSVNSIFDADDFPVVQDGETVQTNASVVKTYVKDGLSKSDVGLGNVDNTSDATKNSATVTLTNKTISGSSNTLSDIGNTSLTNSSITINGNAVSLGGSTTVTATASHALTLGTGLTGTSYNGSTAVTAAIDTSVVTTLTGTQTLTNKTLSGANNTLANIGNSSLVNSSITFGATAVSLGGTVSGFNGVSIGASSASTGAFTNLSYTGTLTGGTGVIAIGTNQIYKDASGNVGIGVTPNTWLSNRRILQIGGSPSAVLSLNGTAVVSEIAHNCYLDVTGVFKYVNTGGACLWSTNSGGTEWYATTSGAAGATATFGAAKMVLSATGVLTLGSAISLDPTTANALVVNSSGNVGIGVGSPVLTLDVERAASTVFSGTGYRVSRFTSTSAAAADKPGVILGFDTSGAGIVAAATQSTGQPLAFWTYNGSTWGERARITSAGDFNVASQTATPAGGSTAARLIFGTTAGFGIYYGSGAPTVSAAQGSIYLRSDGSSTSTRLYVNTNGSTTWTNVTTAA
jgi:hypothetical protein